MLCFVCNEATASTRLTNLLPAGVSPQPFLLTPSHQHEANILV